MNPQEPDGCREPGGRQTVELRSPDGSAIIHLILAGIVMAAEWALGEGCARSGGCAPLELAERLHVQGNIHADRELLVSLPSLPCSCVESSRILLAKRELYERDGVFPAAVVDYIARLLQAENDEGMNRFLVDLPADDRLLETRKIMHKDLHRH